METKSGPQACEPDFAVPNCPKRAGYETTTGVPRMPAAVDLAAALEQFAAIEEDLKE